MADEWKSRAVTRIRAQMEKIAELEAQLERARRAEPPHPPPESAEPAEIVGPTEPSALRSRCERAEEEAEQLRSLLAEAQEELARARDAADAGGQQTGRESDGAKDGQQHATELQQIKIRAIKKIKALEESLSESQRERSRVEQELAQCREAAETPTGMASLQDALAQAHNKAEAAAADTERLHSEAASLRAALAEMQAALAEAKTQRGEALAEVALLREALEEAKASVVKEAREEDWRENETLVEVASLREALQVARAAAEEAETQRGEAVAEIASLRDALEAARSAELRVLKEAEAHRDETLAEVSSLRQMLEQARSAGVPAAQEAERRSAEIESLRKELELERAAGAMAAMEVAAQRDEALVHVASLQQELEESRAAAARAVTEAEQGASEVSAEAESLRKALQEARVMGIAAQEAERQRDAALAELKALRGELEEARAAAAVAMEMEMQRNEALAEVASLKGALEAARVSAEVANVAETQRDSMSAEVVSLRGVLDETMTAMREAENQRDEARAEVAQLRESLEESSAAMITMVNETKLKRDEATWELESLQNALKEARAVAAAATRPEESRAAWDELSSLRVALEEAREVAAATARDAEMQRNEAAAELKSLQEALEEARTKVQGAGSVGKVVSDGAEGSQSSDGGNVKQLESELQQVKLRAVKKIRGLEEKLRSLEVSLEKSNEQTSLLRAQLENNESELAQVRAEERAMAAKAASLEAELTHSSQLRSMSKQTEATLKERLKQAVMQLAEVEERAASLVGSGEMVDEIEAQLAMQMHHNALLTEKLHAESEARERAEAEYERVVGDLSREIAELQEAQLAALNAEAASKLEIQTLLSEMREAKLTLSELQASSTEELASRRRLERECAELRGELERRSPETQGPADIVPILSSAAPKPIEKSALEGPVYGLNIKLLASEISRLEGAFASARMPDRPRIDVATETANLSSKEQGDNPEAHEVRKDNHDVRQKARQLLEEKEKEISRLKAQSVKLQARLAATERRVEEATQAARAGQPAWRWQFEGEPVPQGTRASNDSEQPWPIVTSSTPNGDSAVRGLLPAQRPSVSSAGFSTLATSLLGGLSSESELLLLAQQQATRDALFTAQNAAHSQEVYRAQHDVLQLKAELSLAERELHAMLGRAERREEELRSQVHQLELSKRREGASIEYIKCLVLKLLQLDEADHASLFPALATCLQFTEAEVLQLKRTNENRSESYLGGSFFRTRHSHHVDVTNGLLAAARLQAHEQAQAALRSTERLLEVERLVLDNELAQLESSVAELGQATVRAESEIAKTRDELAALHEEAAELGAKLSHQQSACDELQLRLKGHVADREKQQGELLYLRNVLKRYMETEEHEALFPVIATCLKLTPKEVDDIRKDRDRRRQQERRISSFF